jgi:hypothetical protein
MQFGLLLLTLIFAGCGKMAPPRAVTEAEAGDTYRKALSDLQRLNAEAAEFRKAKNLNAASDRITEGIVPAKILLAVREPSLAALEAVSDHDQMWAEMLMENRHFGHARQMWATEVARWKNYPNPAPSIQARLARAQKGIADCDRQLFKQ